MFFSVSIYYFYSSYKGPTRFQSDMRDNDNITKRITWSPRLTFFQLNSLGTFHSSKESGLNSPEFPVPNGISFFRISEKDQEFWFWFWIFLPKFPELSVEWLALRKFNNLWRFSYQLSPFQNFRNFWLNGKRPVFHFFFFFNSASYIRSQGLSSVIESEKCLWLKVRTVFLKYNHCHYVIMWKWYYDLLNRLY